ncbi:DUF58 domain-containing protein [Blastochloris viridis]|uniref:Possible conserved membrane protein n=1 Tax=Blastochloris viridis TaxID=1079 RepID=A0A0H5BC20_BLAVI|nr:DUF58 domain-containing protein [Blastochloris viridis]ALK10262.1 hypothetical protein BVIR_2496 [Blastochloris viridis]BAR99807.1 possible conserved membrane protein [Blastochloris viridis]CUU42924.1 hypothetical protein BVIRIDIS_19400 [Blastochloris viridis]
MSEPAVDTSLHPATSESATAAASLAAALPRLVLEARRIAQTVVHGLHGRRRAGSGENFWQYRRFTDGEAAARIDWRRSARDDHLYVREQEWEAAHTVWMWPDRSRSMAFASPLALSPKRDRALVVAFALADLLVRGGERVGVPGALRPTASRNIIERMADAILHADATSGSLPPAFPAQQLSEVVMLSDLWEPQADIAAAIDRLAAQGLHGHLVQIVDPVEESFPFSGRVEFFEREAELSIVAGRAEAWRQDYQARLAAHREALRAATLAHGWTFVIHRTDRPATELLLALHARMGEGRAGAGRRPAVADAAGSA